MCPLSKEYIDFVKELSLASDDHDQFTLERCQEFGLSYDNPTISNLHQTISNLAASTIAAAKAIVNKQCHVALNWCGGWHHGLKDEAAGFCYTNDIVFGILTFLENNYRKVLYIDLDLHHGDGVQNAFYHTDKVVTISMHKYEFGFYPGSGDINEIGVGKGKYHSINVPLADGISDDQYFYIFNTVISSLLQKYKPQVIICQLGADCISGDRFNSFNLTPLVIAKCVRLLISHHIPMLLVGGGGYHNANTARLWTLITAICIGKELDVNIPDHENFLHFGPTYELTVIPSMLPNHNTEENIQKKLDVICQNIDKINDS